VVRSHPPHPTKEASLPRILVTGATGHLGAALVRAARARGHDVRALARKTSDRRGIAGVDVEVVEGDLLDPASLAAAVAGCDVVLHAGAVYRNWARDPDEILRPAIEGTANIVNAAAKANVRRVVLCSSNAAVGYGTARAVLLDETSWNTNPKAAYIRAKTVAERSGLDLGAKLGLETVSVCPCGIIGPWDYRRTPTTRGVASMALGGPSVLDLAVTDVRDIAEGHLLAAERGKPGERYLLAGENCTRERVAELMTAVTGRKVRAMLPPRAVMWLIAAFGELRARAGGPDADLTRDAIADVYGRHLMYDHGKAVRELGWTFRPAADVIRDAVRWLIFLGDVKPIAGLEPDPTWTR
jgi:dihydroflavonol-4-reductase